MRTILLLIFVNLLITETSNGTYFRDTTDLAHITSPVDSNFVQVLSIELLKEYLLSEIEVSCPSVVLVTYNEQGNKQTTESYPLNHFIENLQQHNLFKQKRIYLILTRFKTYYFSNLNRQN
ncbi:hypothetical protein JMN32_10655 [Fulvivirga sp. 29W222]|uniref:Uncharacterized protein n=1 Tax=Fulvivirga marina TaxID=2494733 RepID=A0A937FVF5_9BACT|nr:hypothetical protein [Fulvivirga marina]MBL6446774.1 hypothetical protein [Fulvivirga marina]